MSKQYVQSKNLLTFLNKKYGTDLKASDDGMTLRKEVFTREVTSVNEEDGTCECVISCEEVDRGGDVVKSDGIDTADFAKIPSVYINHNYAALPIAKCLELTHKAGSIHAKIQFALNVPEIKYIFERVKAGVLRGVSIGFEVKEMMMRGTKEFDTYCKDMLTGKYSQEDMDKIQRVFTKWNLYEFSICSVPANQSCFVKSLDEVSEVTTELKEGLNKYGYGLLVEKDIPVKIEHTDEVRLDVDPKTGDITEITPITKNEKTEMVIKEILKNEEKPAEDTEVKDEEDEGDEAETHDEEVAMEMEDHKEVVVMLEGLGLSKEQIEEVFEQIVMDELAEDPDFYSEEAEEEVEKITKPVGPFATFDECVLHMTEKEGYDLETARKVCGSMEAEGKIGKEEPKEPVKEPAKSIPSYWNVIRTPDVVETYIKKAVEAKISGKLEIDW